MEVLKVENVVKQFGDYRASKNISFSVKKGSIMGLLGPNGAGKTTMIRMITNILMPDSGNITINGEKLQPAHQNIIGYLPEERGLYKKIKVIDQLVYFAQLKGLDRKTAYKTASEWLNNLDALDWAQKKIQELSKGMQQKVQFIGTILHNPELLILDEPFSGFDPINTELLKKIIMDLKAEGKTIILSTHVMEQAEQLCDDICLLNKGSIVLKGKLEEIKQGYGRDTVVMEFAGDDSFLGDLKNVKFINRSKNRVEFRITDNSTKGEDILKRALGKTELYKFEMAAPSLHEIFIDTVSKAGEDA